MAAENSDQSNLKTYTSTRKNTFSLVTLQSFSTSGVISAEKMSVENWKIYRRLYDWGYMSINFSIFDLHFSADFAPVMLKLCRVTKVKVFFLMLGYIFTFS